MTQPRPPLPWLLAYRVLGLRLPDEHRAWVAEDVASKHFVGWRVGRTILWITAGFATYYVVQSVMHSAPALRLLGRLYFGSAAVALLASRKTLVRRTLRWQRLDRHGRPVRPKRLAVLGNQEAVVIGAATAIAVTGAMAVFAYGLRPTSCRTPSTATMNLIRGGLKDKATQIIKPQALPFGEPGTQTMVGAQVKKPDQDNVTYAFWIITRDKVYEIRSEQQAAQSATTFDKPPTVDRTGVEAVQTVANCLSRVSR